MPYGWDVYEFRGEPDLEAYKVWILSVVHCVPAWTPLFIETWLRHTVRGLLYAGDVSCFPTAKGHDWRIYNGHAYATVVVTREDERPRREALFREKMAPVFEDPFGYWEGLKSELKDLYGRLTPLDVEKMSDGELLHHLWDCWNMLHRVWEIHFLGFYSFTSGMALFRDLCHEMFGIKPTDVTFAKLMSGFDNALFQLNKGLADLATRAMELGVAETISALPDEEVLQKLDEKDVGKQWLQSFRDFLKIGGCRMVRMNEYSTPSWMEKPSLVIPEIRRMLAVGGVHAPEVQRERLVREREEIEEGLLAKVSEEQREWFAKLMRTAQASHFFSEDHCYWCEFIAHSIYRRAVIEFGKRFVKAGIMNDPEDISMLFFEEIRRTATIQERYDLRPTVDRRREEHNRYLSMVPGSEELPIFLGNPAHMETLARADALIAVIAPSPIAAADEVGATVVGTASAPGVVEGIARVVMSPAELNQVQPGEILIAPATDANWTPVFSVVKGVVTDGGGVLAHAAIVSREYGIPAIVGCLEATRKIKTGDRIKVDGDLLRVYVLE